MVDVTNKRCLEENCNVQPKYNLPDKKNGVYLGVSKLNKFFSVQVKICFGGCAVSGITDKYLLDG